MERRVNNAVKQAVTLPTRSNSSVREEYASQVSRKKIFAKDEGEYVDYEEVK